VIPAQVRIFVCAEPVDMRSGFDRLALLASQRVGLDAQSGALFVFCGKRATRLKVLWFDHNGYCLLYKRLHDSVFVLPVSGANKSVQIDGAQLATILQGHNAVGKKSKRTARRRLTVDADELSMQP
jgi:transposase